MADAPANGWPVTPGAPRPKTHEIKCWPAYFHALADGRKTFELRRDDRDYRAGDTLHVREWCPTAADYTGRALTFGVSYVLRKHPEFGLEGGFAILSLTPAEVAAREAAAAEAMRADDPQRDATDAAHPAWWRGNDHGVEAVVKIVNGILDGAAPGTHGSAALTALVHRLARVIAEAEARGMEKGRLEVLHWLVDRPHQASWVATINDVIAALKDLGQPHDVQWDAHNRYVRAAAKER